jgi:Tol biopolymer transport system component
MKKLIRLLLGGLVAIVAITLTTTIQAGEKRLFTLDDVSSIREVSEPQVSPDGNWVVYVVAAPDLKEDKNTSDLWMTSWDNKRTVRLTSSKTSEASPRWSPDGQYLAFLSDRSNEDEINQLWLMDRAGGEAERITNLPGGVRDHPPSKRPRRGFPSPS